MIGLFIVSSSFSAPWQLFTVSRIVPAFVVCIFTLARAPVKFYYLPVKHCYFTNLHVYVSFYRCVFGLAVAVVVVYVAPTVGTTTGPIVLRGDLFPLLLFDTDDDDDDDFGVTPVPVVLLLVREVGSLVTDPRREVADVFTEAPAALGAVFEPLLGAWGVGWWVWVDDELWLWLWLWLTCRTECSGWARDDSMGNVRRNCCQVTVSLS